MSLLRFVYEKTAVFVSGSLSLFIFSLSLSFLWIAGSGGSYVISSPMKKPM